MLHPLGAGKLCPRGKEHYIIRSGTSHLQGAGRLCPQGLDYILWFWRFTSSGEGTLHPQGLERFIFGDRNITSPGAGTFHFQ